MGDRSLWAALAFGLCNAGEALLVAWLIERWFGPAFNLDNLRRVLGFFASAAAATATAAAGASFAMKLFGPSTAGFLDVWKVWFASDALGVMTVAPLLIGIAAAARDAPSSRDVLEGTSAVVVVSVANGLALALLTGSWSLMSPAVFLFPLLLWLGSRCRPVFAAAAVFTICAAIVWTTINDLGRYGDPSQPIVDRVLAAQVAMLGTTLAALALAALFAERRRHEATIVASETRIRSILDAAKVIAWEVDLIRDTVHVEGPIARFLDKPDGMPTDGFAAFAATIHPEDRDRAMAEFLTALKASTNYQLEFRLPSSSGDARWVTAEGAIERDDTGRAVSIRGITRDITARKQAEERLQKSELKLRELLGALPAAIYVTDAAGHITYCNQSAIDLWGAEPALGKDMWSDFSKFFYADGSPMPLADCPTDIALKKGRVAGPGREAIIGRKGGTRIPIAPFATPLRDETGAIVGIVNMTVDISERKKAELALAERNLQLALAGRAALVGSFAYDIGTEEIQVSVGYAAIHGLPEGTTHIARGQWQSGVHPDDRGRVDELRSRVFDDQRSEYAIEYRIVRSGGEVRWIEARCFVSYRSDGNPQRVVGVNIDVTKRKRDGDHQRMLIAELDHRVKNVLATVSAVAACTLDTSSTMDQFVAALDGRIRSMATTHELLSGRGWKGIPLAELLRHQLAPYATTNNMDVKGPDVLLSAGAGQTIGMVFHELITNAAKYGALSTRNGRLSVRWDWPRNGKLADRLVIKWGEIGGPAVKAPARVGHGMEVIRDLVPYELEGNVDLTFAPEGVRCRFDIPLSRLTNDDPLGNECDGSDLGQPIGGCWKQSATALSKLERDMTLHEEAQAAQTQRMEAFRQLAGGMAHDFNNVLAAISAYLDAVTLRSSDEKTSEAIEGAMGAIQMGASLNRRLLFLSRPQGVGLERLDLNDRVTRTLELLKRTLGEQVTVSLRLSLDPCRTSANPGDVDTAILDLAINARDAMPQGGTLTIETRQVTIDADAAGRIPEAQPGDYVTLTVSDTGHGMSSEILKHAMEPFFTTKGPGKGPGLGLATVYGIVRQSVGFISIDSTVGKGTSVHLNFPRAEPGSIVSTARAQLGCAPQRPLPLRSARSS
jgi:PAS domain S-box-containing protein